MGVACRQSGALTMALILLMLAAGVMGWIGGGLVNWAADILPGIGGQDAPPSPRTPRWRYWAPIGATSSHRHRLIIIVSIVLAALMAWHWGWDTKLIVGWLYGFFLLAVIIIDFEHHRVLNVMVAPAAVVAAIFSLLPFTPTPLFALLGGAAGFGVFLLLAIIGRGALGMGDVKLAGVIGLMTGYPNVFWALVIGALVGAGAALFLLLSRKATRKTAIAYAPYLAIGAFVILWAGL